MTYGRNELDRDLETIVSEIEGLLLAGGVLGICAVIVNKDGSVTQRIRYIQDGKFPLVAGVTLTLSDLIELAKRKGNTE